MALPCLAVRRAGFYSKYQRILAHPCTDLSLSF